MGHYVERVIRIRIPKSSRCSFLTYFESGLTGYKESRKNAENTVSTCHGSFLIDPHDWLCNMLRTGHGLLNMAIKMNLSYEELDSVITQGKKLGIRAYLFTWRRASHQKEGHFVDSAKSTLT